jgi:hypothetical protein
MGGLIDEEEEEDPEMENDPLAHVDVLHQIQSALVNLSESTPQILGAIAGNLSPNDCVAFTSLLSR